jgi:hypothetical protein
MNTLLYTKCFAIGLFLVCGLLASGNTYAQQPADSIVFSGASFHPRCSSIKYNTNGMMLKTIARSDDPSCFPSMYLAPVRLPHGSTIQDFYATIYQKNNGKNAYPVKVRLLRTAGEVNSYRKITEIVFPTITESGDYTLSELVPEADKIVNANKYAYFIQVELPFREGVDRFFDNVTIYYTVP